MAVQTKIQFRRDLAANWNTIAPVLSAAEIGYETDTGNFKIGDGSTNWLLLEYAKSGATTSYSELTGIPATFTPSPHTHVLADITDYSDPQANFSNNFLLMGA